MDNPIKNIDNPELKERLYKCLESLSNRSFEFVTYDNKPSVTLSPEAEVALRLLPFVTADNEKTNHYVTLETQIKKAQELAKEFMNYKPE